jgi:phospholipid/cholesterol/gamma-HCH transport system permease protein
MAPSSRERVLHWARGMVEASAAPAFTVHTRADGARWIALTGEWNLRSLGPRLRRLRRQFLGSARIEGWDLTAVTAMDHAGAMLLWRAWGRRWADPLRMQPEHRRLFEHLRHASEAPPVPPRAYGWHPLLVVGGRTLSLLDHVAALVTLLGNVALSAVHVLRNAQRIPWLEITANIYRTGAQALAITALVGFLVGVVLSYLSAQQLRTFGADIYIVNLLGVSVIRELGPVLAAILIAGRSGSAMTAQLGVMRVTQELDAMAVMGIPHTLRLVLPKMLALGISMPLIILWTDAIALIGGMVTAHIKLGITYHYFVGSLQDAVPIANLWLGLGKGVVFGVFIALIACHFGLRVEPNTVSLGEGTTASVVSSITAVILIDALFAVMFSDVGIFQ